MIPKTNTLRIVEQYKEFQCLNAKDKIFLNSQP